MIRNVLLIAALLAISEAAVLVRFVNTVPTRIARDSNTAILGATVLDASTYDARIDRVGLQYFSDVVSTPTIVWTTQLDQALDIVSPSATGATGFTAPYAYLYALPPLRAYHTVKVAATENSEVVGIDRPFGVLLQADNSANAIDQRDVYTQDRLFADGVGLYMTFAAGTYKMQAYGVVATVADATTQAQGLAAVKGATARGFTGSSTSFTFADNKVYTIIAYGTGQFGQTTPLNGNTVRLTLIEESIAATTFGMASVRFFNAFGAQTNSFDVYSTSTATDSTRIASGVAVGTVSSYIDVAPGTNREFPVLVSGSTSNFLASGINVQRDIRAGSRQTVICGIWNEASNIGFCRGIPSRVVAYVRLVADTTSQDGVVQGKAGAQKLSLTNLNLFASYEYPRPEEVQEQSQVIGTQTYTGHPVTTQGLYPVVVNVAPGKISGYGEVFIPIYIMDLAVRSVIGRTNEVYTAASKNTDFSAPVNYIFSPNWKRVNFVLKTDGMATLSGRAAAAGGALGDDNYIFPFQSVFSQGKPKTAPAETDVTKRFTTVNTGYSSLAKAITVDRYVEAGEYYTMFASAQQATTVATSTQLQIPAQLEVGDILQIFWRRDRNLNQVTTALTPTAGKGTFTVVAFGNQALPTATMSLLQSVTNAQAISLTTPNGVSNTESWSTAGAARVLPIDASGNSATVNAGTYSYAISGAGNACNNFIPANGGAITVAENGFTDLFVLNQFGCRVNGQGAETQRLVAVVQQRGPASATNNSPFATTTTRDQRHPAAATL